MAKKIEKYMLVAGVGILGGVIIKKLNDIQAEIEYLERQQGIYNNRKDYGKIQEQRYGIY